MKAGLRSILAVTGLIALGMSASTPARAQIISNGEVAGVVAGIAGAGALIGVGVYYAVHHNPSVTGCAQQAAGGLQLQTDNSHETWALVGDLTSIKPGERVRVSGKRQKHVAGAPPVLL